MAIALTVAWCGVDIATFVCFDVHFMLVDLNRSPLYRVLSRNVNSVFSDFRSEFSSGMDLVDL